RRARCHGGAARGGGQGLHRALVQVERVPDRGDRHGQEHLHGGGSVIHEDKELKIVVEDDGTVTMRFDPGELDILAGVMGEVIHEDDDPELADLQWRISEAARFASYGPDDPGWKEEPSDGT